jgi:hypothetical protein
MLLTPFSEVDRRRWLGYKGQALKDSLLSIVYSGVYNGKLDNRFVCARFGTFRQRNINLNLKTFINAKQSAIAEWQRALVLGDSEKIFQEEFEKGAEADPDILRHHIHRIAVALNPSRKEQVERQLAEGHAGKRMLAICDFSQIPYTFDLVVFLFVANRARMDQGCDKLDIVFVAHASDPVPQNNPPEMRLEEYYRMLIDNIGWQGTRLLETVGSVMCFDNRELFQRFFEKARQTHDIYPSYYYPSNPVYRTSTEYEEAYFLINLYEHAEPEDVMCLKVPDAELQIAKKWIRKYVYPAVPVTLTLRQFDHLAHKNTNLDIWSDVANRFLSKDIVFIVVPEFYRAFDAPELTGDNIVYCDEAVLSLPFRAALYELSAFNIFGNNGSGALALLSTKMDYIWFDTGGLMSARSEELKRREGLVPGERFRNASERQRVVWGDFGTDEAEQEIKIMLELLSNDGSLSPKWYSTV